MLIYALVAPCVGDSPGLDTSAVIKRRIHFYFSLVAGLFRQLGWLCQFCRATFNYSHKAPIFSTSTVMWQQRGTRSQATTSNWHYSRRPFTIGLKYPLLDNETLDSLQFSFQLCLLWLLIQLASHHSNVTNIFISSSIFRPIKPAVHLFPIASVRWLVGASTQTCHGLETMSHSELVCVKPKHSCERKQTKIKKIWIFLKLH